MSERHASVEFVLQFFSYAHLKEPLQSVSKQFHDLAQKIADGPQNAETTVALRKLVEAKDCAVRVYVAEQNRLTSLEKAAAP